MLTFFRNLLRVKAGVKPAMNGGVDFQLMTEGSNDVILWCDADARARYVSPSCVRLFGWTPEEVVGQNAANFIYPDDMPTVLAAQKALATDLESSVLSFRLRRKDGTLLWVEGSARLAIDPATGSRDCVLVLRDITQRKDYEDRLSALAMTDALTGLANRRAFDAKLETEWARTRRVNGMLSLLLIDLDHFKGFNDHYGHQVGDDCLRAVASAIRTSVGRPADMTARYGGEEIAAILPDTDLTGAVAIAETMRMAVEALHIPHVTNGPDTAFVTISVGAATALSKVGGSIQMPAGLLQAADMALYKAKTNGRNRIETALMLTGSTEG